MTGTIYALRDPASGEIRYIGQTWGTLDEKLRKMVLEARAGKPRGVLRWMRTLTSTPLIEVLTSGYTEQDALDEAECAAIAAHPNLTNETAGGGGGKKKPELRARMSVIKSRVHREHPEIAEAVSRSTRRRMAKPEEKERVRRETKERWNAMSDEERSARVRNANAARWRKSCTMEEVA